MKKKRTQAAVQPTQQAPVNQESPANTTAFPMSDMKPSDELQIYYNDAYLREKQRFNEIFGIIEQPQPEKEYVYVEPSYDEYVPLKKHKKVKRTANTFVVLTVLFAIATAALAALLLLK